MGSGDDRVRGDGDPGGDSALVRQLAAEPCDSPLWHEFRERFFTVVGAALHHRIRAEAPVRTQGKHSFAALGSLDQQRARRDADLRTAWVVDAMIDAYDTFVDRLRRGEGWQDGRAPLDYYLVGGGLLALAEQAKKRRRVREQDAAHLVDDDPLDVPGPEQAGPEERTARAAYARAAAEVLETRDELVSRAVRLRVETEEKWDLIAGRLGVSPATLDRRRRAAADYLRRVLDERGEGDARNR